MPGKKKCAKIKDPAARARCLKYAGEFAKPKSEMSRVRSSKQGGY